MLFQTGFRVVLLVFSLTIPFLLRGISPADAETDGRGGAATVRRFDADRFVVREIGARVDVIDRARIAVEVEAIHAKIDRRRRPGTIRVGHARRCANAEVTPRDIRQQRIVHDRRRGHGIVAVVRFVGCKRLVAARAGVKGGVGAPDIVLQVDGRGRR